VADLIHGRIREHGVDSRAHGLRSGQGSTQQWDESYSANPCQCQTWLALHVMVKLNLQCL
jgi:hypothetical protein